MKRLAALALVLLWAGVATAVPRMSLPAGSPCATCHHNPTGGGGRNVVGWSSMSRTGAFDPAWFSSNSLMDEHITLGLDTRFLLARLGRPTLQLDDAGREKTEVPAYRMFPMQIQANAGISVTEWLKAYGNFGTGPKTWSGELCDASYAGQSCFEAVLQAETQNGITVRGGMFQPTIGIRPDDHTTLIRSDALNHRRPVIPPNYAELGGEIGYQPVSWFRLEAGVTHTGNLDLALNDTAQTAKLSALGYTGRLTFLPRFEFAGSAPKEDDFGEDDFATDEAPPPALHTWFGASILGSGEFYLLSAFLGAGLQNGLESRLEFAHSARSDEHKTYNASLSASWTFRDWLVPAIRIDRAVTDADKEYTTWQYVAGLEFFPLPFVEIRPEYRLVKTNDYLLGQPTVQVHLFY